ncbi:MAG: hypothetical protein ABI222_15185 [Opitutaceae bacterium]
MKIFFAPLLLLAALALTGCDSLPNQAGGREGPPPVTVRTFHADPRAVYDAARISLTQMAFRITRGGPAQGKIEAVSGLSTDEARRTRQITMSIRISDLGDGNCEVTAVLKEAIEEDSTERQGFATQTTLRDTPYYEVFFTGLGNALGQPKKV